MSRHDVLDKGYIELIDVMGDDLSIVNAARTSFDAASIKHMRSCPLVDDGHPKSHEWPECMCETLDRNVGDPDPRVHLSERDAGLINFLMENRHGTPFEMVNLKFAVKAPIFVFREWHRHRMASINEMSGRYVELEREFYIPDSLDVREQKGKPGAYYYEPVRDHDRAEMVRGLIWRTSDAAFRSYEAMLEDGIAKEVARVVLPLNTYSKMVWSVNLRGAMNFLSLRNHEHAQKEIRYYAQRMEMIMREVVPWSMEAFVKHGRTAP